MMKTERFVAAPATNIQGTAIPPPLELVGLALLPPVATVQFDASNAGVMVLMPVAVAGPALPPAPP